MEEDFFRIYMTDCAFMVVNNIAQIAGGYERDRRYIDILDEFDQPVDTRTADEVALDIIEAAGLTMKKGG